MRARVYEHCAARFHHFGKVAWAPGLILAIGSMTGAHLAVKLAVRASPAQAVMVMLDDATPDNGCMFAVCGRAA